jgi:hypothetical protein
MKEFNGRLVDRQKVPKLWRKLVEWRNQYLIIKSLVTKSLSVLN